MLLLDTELTIVSRVFSYIQGLQLDTVLTVGYMVDTWIQCCQLNTVLSPEQVIIVVVAASAFSENFVLACFK